jgi:hypothetical protein
MLTEELAAPAVSLAEAQAYVRAETGEEEAVLAGPWAAAMDFRARLLAE